jgi:hypothetical protein
VGCLASACASGSTCIGIHQVVWYVCPQAAVKTELVKTLVEQQSTSVVHKVCDTVAELAADLLDKGAWPELLGQLQGLVGSGNPKGASVRPCGHVSTTWLALRAAAAQAER